MNILLVDDNRIVLDSLLSGINFSDLGFQNVYTARSAKEAEEILHEKDIQIMIADIEMPGESGLKLLERVNHERTDMVTIFCTSYADFNYAQEAIRLHCFDYYVKPIKYKTFEEHLKKAIQEVEYRFRQKIEREYGEYWESNFWNIKVGFWHRLFFGLLFNALESIQRKMRKRTLKLLK